MFKIKKLSLIMLVAFCCQFTLTQYIFAVEAAEPAAVVTTPADPGTGASAGGGTVFCNGQDCGINAGGKIVEDKVSDTGIKKGTLVEMILHWVKVALSLLGILAFVAFLWAGFLYLTSFANEENAEKAKKIMIMTIIGIVVILFSYILTDFFLKLGVQQ